MRNGKPYAPVNPCKCEEGEETGEVDWNVVSFTGVR